MIRSLLVGIGLGGFAVLSAASCSSGGSTMDAGTDTGMMVMDTGGGGMDVKADKAPIDTGTMVMCPNPKPDISGFMAASLPPSRMSAPSCSSMQITDYFNACYGMGATNMTCSNYRMAALNMTCVKCIESTDTDAQWGPLISGTGMYVTMGTVKANYEGCLAKLGETACADDTFKAGLCNKYACEEQCPVSDTQSYNEYNKCTTKASTTVCKMYTDKQNTSCGSPEAGAAIAQCKGSNFQDYYTKAATVFCGGLIVDAGGG